MEVRFWGTRGSLPTPGPRTVRFGGNTACVEVRTGAGHVFIFDCGTGARPLGDALTAPGPPLGADGAGVVYACDHEPFGGALWRSDTAAGRIESILHEGDRRHARFLADADLVIHDAQYTPEEYRARKNWGHSPFDYVVELAGAAGVNRLALTHHDPSHDDATGAEIARHARAVAERRRTPIEVFCAFEGRRLTLGARGGAPAAAPEVASAPARAVTPRARILVVDDHPVLPRPPKGALQNDRYVLPEATNGREALEVRPRAGP